MVQKVHEHIAQTYDSGDRILDAKNKATLDLLGDRLAGWRDPVRVIDMGVGDGAVLAQLFNNVDANFRFTGADLSRNMLARAADTVPLTTIHTDSAHLDAHTAPEAYDVALAHFILAYVDLDTVLRQAWRLLSPGGLLSLSTSTNETARNARPYVERLKKGNPWERLVARRAEHSMADTTTPDDHAAIVRTAEGYGFRELDRRRQETPLTFNNADDLFTFTITKGWGANILAYRWLPVRLGLFLAHKAMHLVPYPVETTHVVENLVLEKPA